MLKYLKNIANNLKDLQMTVANQNDILKSIVKDIVKDNESISTSNIRLTTLENKIDTIFYTKDETNNQIEKEIQYDKNYNEFIKDENSNKIFSIIDLVLREKHDNKYDKLKLAESISNLYFK